MRNIEAVTWLDPTSHSGWFTLEEVKRLGLSTCTSIGTIIEEDDTTLKIASGFCNDDSVGDICIVHKVLVTGRKIIAEV